MKKALSALLLILTLFACKESEPSYTLEGFYGNGNDTLFIFGNDRRHDRIDTLISKKDGSFLYNIKTDTIIPMTLLLPNGKMLTLYAEPNQKATLTTDTLHKGVYRIVGGEAQHLHDSISAAIDSTDNKSKIEDIIRAFTIAHPYSDININLITKYLAEKKEPDGVAIRERIEDLGGTLQDNIRIQELTQKSDRKQGNLLYRSFPDFNITLADSTKRTNSDYRNKHLVVTFWASWDSSSIKRLKEYGKLKALKDTAHFALLNISFDYDTAAWRRTLTNDSIPGDNFCDTKAWNNDIAKSFTISELPYSIHVNPYQRTNKFGIDEQFLQNNIDSLINRLKEDIKKREERERKRKEEEDKKKKKK